MADANQDNGGIEQFQNDEPQQPPSAAEPQRADPEQPTSDVAGDPYLTEKEGGRIYIWLSILVVIVGVVVIVVMLTVVGDDDDDNASTNTAPTQAPTFTPPEMISNPDERLSVLLEAMGSDPFLGGESVIPSQSDLLIGKVDGSDVDPMTKAASWVVHSDSYFAEEEIVSRFVMAVLWYNNGGEQWIVKDNWMSSVSVCDWEGVTCCKDVDPKLQSVQCIGKHHLDVVELDLHGNGLTGPIPGSLSLLDACHTLWLSNNLLDGGLDPALFKNMKSLKALYVQNNQLSGEIDGSIRDNGRLDTIFTHGNHFTGFWPPQLCPKCVSLGLCTMAPIAFTLDCDEMTCEDKSCCDAVDSSLGHCIRGSER